MNICEKCKKNPSSHSAIVAGIYYKHLCDDCKIDLGKNQTPSSGHARWSRGIDLEDHEADIQQPWNADGTPNARFAKMYPKQAHAVLTEDELRKAV